MAEQLWVKFFCKRCGVKTSAKFRTGREEAQLCMKCYLEESHKKRGVGHADTD